MYVMWSLGTVNGAPFARRNHENIAGLDLNSLRVFDAVRAIARTVLQQYSLLVGRALHRIREYNHRYGKTKRKFLLE